MRVLIVDDEAPARRRLGKLLDELGGVDIVGEAANGREALDRVQELQPEALLLDIRMPGMDGMEVARELARQNNAPAIIFITAYGEHALQAFEVQALDYLVKPIRKERLQQALGRLREWLGGTTEESQTLSIQRQGKITLLPVAEIFLLHADNKYVTAYHLHGEAVLEDSLKSLEEKLGSHFLRIHRNALVAKSYLLGIERDANGTYHALIRNCELHPEISRRMVAEVKAFLQRADLHQRPLLQ